MVMIGQVASVSSVALGAGPVVPTAAQMGNVATAGVNGSSGGAESMSLSNTSHRTGKPDPSDTGTRDSSMVLRGLIPHQHDKSLFVNGTNYPRIILGGDKFLDYWGPQSRPELATVEGVFLMMGHAYELGARGFDVSLNSHVIKAFRRFKALHSDAVGIGNPNWRCGIKLADADICDLRDRILKSIRARYLTASQIEEIAKLDAGRQRRWFFESDDTMMPLDAEEVRQIYLDEAVYKSKLEMLRGLTDYLLIGTDYADWLIVLVRNDILQRMTRLASECGFRLLSISHWASITLPELDRMGFEGHWTYFNKDEQLLSTDSARASVAACMHPVTAFRTLSGGALAGDLQSAFEYLRAAGIASAVIGAEEPSQLTNTIPVLKTVFGI